MATLRPHKQLPLLPLVSVSPRKPRAPATLSGGNSLRTPSFCRPLPRHPAPYPPPRPGSVRSRPRTPRRARRGAWLGASAEAPGPSACGSSRAPRSRPTPPHPLRSEQLRGVDDGSWEAAPGSGAKAGSRLRLGNHVLGVFLSSGLRVALPHVSAARHSLLTLSVFLVPAGRSDSPMPPAAQVCRTPAPVAVTPVRVG